MQLVHSESLRGAICRRTVLPAGLALTGTGRRPVRDVNTIVRGKYVPARMPFPWSVRPAQGRQSHCGVTMKADEAAPVTNLTR